MFKKSSTRVIEPPVVMDTSAIIDGRILAVAQTGFIPDRLILPQFIITELQQLADGPNTHKRERARFGMDIIKELQEIKDTRVIINRDKFPNIEEVDDKLVALAKQVKGYLFTTDYNLGKVAEIEGIKVLNVNELAQSLRPVILPGQTLELKIIQKGNERGQGVAYLDDGTMVVVENGSKFVGKKVKIEFSRTLQTVAGKMMFANIVGRPSSSRESSYKKPAAQNKPRSSRYKKRDSRSSRDPKKSKSSGSYDKGPQGPRPQNKKIVR